MWVTLKGRAFMSETAAHKILLHPMLTCLTREEKYIQLGKCIKMGVSYFVKAEALSLKVCALSSERVTRFNMQVNLEQNFKIRAFGCHFKSTVLFKLVSCESWLQCPLMACLNERADSIPIFAYKTFYWLFQAYSEEEWKIRPHTPQDILKVILQKQQSVLQALRVSSLYPVTKSAVFSLMHRN